jgi:hypothetical protein
MNKEKLINNGVYDTINTVNYRMDVMIFVTIIMTITAFAGIIICMQRNEKIEVLEWQVSQRDSIIQQYKCQEMQLINYNINLSKHDEVK